MGTETKTNGKLQLGRLTVQAIDAKPRDFDFSNDYPERWDVVYPDFDEWTLEQCEAFLSDRGGDRPDPDPWKMDRDGLAELLENQACIEPGNDDEDTLRTAAIVNINDDTIEGLKAWQEAARESLESNLDELSPMMNYLYPLPDFEHGKLTAEALQTILMDQCLVVVCVDDDGGGGSETYYLALTGGGMDLSWEICHAYILAGYLPPTHFELPAMAGKPSTDTDRLIIQACKQANEVAQQWAGRRLERLAELENRKA